FGRRFAALRDQPELARSGLIAQVSGYFALGLADSARAAARELRGGGPELNVFAPELDGALLLVDADCAEGDARWAELSRALAEHARSRASTDATRRRAAWDRPGGPPQVGDMDWAFGTLARWHQAVLLEQAGETGACRAYAAVAGAWAGGDTPFRARADSAAQRVKQLHCGAP